MIKRKPRKLLLTLLSQALNPVVWLIHSIKSLEVWLKKYMPVMNSAV